jgi:ubiquinone/menaquinone biosynthesis C-methylase UbiE
MNTAFDHYLLGSSNEELDRLAFQHQTWKPEAQALWDRAGIRAGDSVLDLGCGPGFASIDLAQQVGANGRIIALDLSQTFLAHLQQMVNHRGIKNIQTMEGNVESFTLLHKVDFIYSRWLFCFLKNPGKVIDQLSANLKRGGRVAICDYFALDYILQPASEIFNRLLRAVSESWRISGGNICIQQSLPQLLEKRGFEIIELKPVSHVSPPHAPHWNCPVGFWKVYVPQLVGQGLFSQKEADQFWIEIREREKNPASLLKTPTLLEIIAEKI